MRCDIREYFSKTSFQKRHLKKIRERLINEGLRQSWRQERVIAVEKECLIACYLLMGNCIISYLDLPERLECAAFGQNILHPDNISCKGENIPHLLPGSIDVWSERWRGSIDYEYV
jgi:hypothetical protein